MNSKSTTARNTPRPSTAQAAKEGASPAPAPVTGASQAAAPALDLTSLEQRLRETSAIGLFTKLSLKNQVDDLLAQFKAFHQGQSRSTLSALRQKYELLLVKVISLLQDRDASLAASISASREAIWAILVDPKKFNQL